MSSVYQLSSAEKLIHEQLFQESMARLQAAQHRHTGVKGGGGSSSNSSSSSSNSSNSSEGSASVYQLPSAEKLIHEQFIQELKDNKERSSMSHMSAEKCKNIKK